MTPESELTSVITADGERMKRLARINRTLTGAVAIMTVVIVALGVWVITQAGADDALQDDIDAAAQVVNDLNSVVEAGDTPSVGAFFAEDAFYEDPAAGMEVTGRSSVQAMFGSFMGADSPIDNTAVFVGPDFAVTEFVWTQPCSFAACGESVFMEPIEVRGAVVQVIEDGEITRETDYIAYPRGPILSIP